MVDTVDVVPEVLIPLYDGDDTYFYFGRDASGKRCAWFSRDASAVIGASASRPTRSVLVTTAGDVSSTSVFTTAELTAAVRRWAAARLLEYAGTMLGGRVLVFGGHSAFTSVLRVAAAAIGTITRQVPRSSDLFHDTREFTAVIALQGGPVLSRVLPCVMTGGRVVLAAPLGAVDLDLYPDVHRRNVSLIGVPALASPDFLAPTGGLDAVVGRAL